MATENSRTRAPKPVTSAEVRAWAEVKGMTVGRTGRIPQKVVLAWNKSHKTRQFDPDAPKATAA